MNNQSAQLIFAASLVVGVLSYAGPEFVEDDDAGPTTSNAAPVVSAQPGGPVSRISGVLTGSGSDASALGFNDFEDVYQINISDPDNFSVSTRAADGGLAQFDSSLYVFDAEGFGLLGNKTAASQPKLLGGGDYFENGDAGPLPANAQAVEGDIGQPLDFINGCLGTSDFEDMFLINITNPEEFFASTALSDGFADFDSQLWLFKADELGLLANDDTQAIPLGGLSGSTFFNAANDGSGAMLTEPGLYYLAISLFSNDPFSSDEQAIFNLLSTLEVSGPDGPGGANPIEGWTGLPVTAATATGKSKGGKGIVCYGIALGGVSFISDGGALLGNSSNDGTEVVINEPGIYYLAISSDANNPLDSNGDNIFAFDLPDEVSGPDGPGGEGVLTQWNSSFDEANGNGFGSGAYEIVLTGVIGVDGEGVCGPEAGSCFQEHGTIGCNDPECCEAVCAVDAFCCEVAWDGICVDEAFDICAPCGPESCFVPHKTTGCNDPECCQLVCVMDPFCCESEWDSECVAAAEAECVAEVLCGDFDTDDDVDTDDLMIFLAAYGSSLGDANYLADADFDGDDTIGLTDYGFWYQCYLDYVSGLPINAPPPLN